jgi:CBS domain-containing protein
MNIEEIMTKDPAVCIPTTNLADVARTMVQMNCGAVPVVDDLKTMKPVGMVTDRDITLRTLANGRNPLEMTAKDVMTINPVSLPPDTSIDDCCKVMENRAIRRILVTDGAGKCVGIVAQADIAQTALEENVAELVKDISVASYAASGII